MRLIRSESEYRSIWPFVVLHPSPLLFEALIFSHSKISTLLQRNVGACQNHHPPPTCHSPPPSLEFGSQQDQHLPQRPPHTASEKKSIKEDDCLTENFIASTHMFFILTGKLKRILSPNHKQSMREDAHLAENFTIIWVNTLLYLAK